MIIHSLNTWFCNRYLFQRTGETLHMSQQEKSPLWIQSPEETSRVWIHSSRFSVPVPVPYYTQLKHNKAEVSIRGVEMFYIQVSFGPQKINVEYKLRWQSSYHMYVVSRHLDTRTCCLLRAVVSNGIFYVLFLYVAYM